MLKEESQFSKFIIKIEGWFMAIHFKEAAFLVHQAFRELAVHEMKLATSLQSLVPSNREPKSKSAQYLYENSLMLKELSQKVKELLVHRSADAARAKPPG